MLWVASSVQAQQDSHAPTTVNLRQNDFELCTRQFYVDLYELTVAVFAPGAVNVKLAELEEQIFTLVRTSDEFAGGGAEAFVEHIKDIPAQLLQIIREDPAVLDSCANFSVALVGPP